MVGIDLGVFKMFESETVNPMSSARTDSDNITKLNTESGGNVSS